MAAEWFCQAAGHRYGPITSGELRRLADTGIVTPDTLVRKGADGRWVRAEKVQGLFDPSDSPRNRDRRPEGTAPDLLLLRRYPRRQRANRYSLRARRLLWGQQIQAGTSERF